MNYKNNKNNINNILFESLPIGLAVTRMDGSMVRTNPAFAKIVGRTNVNISKLSYWQLTPADYSENEEEQLKILQDSGYNGPYEKEYYHIDGHRVPVRLHGRVINHDGEDQIWSSVEDISEAKRIERNTKRFTSTLDETLDCVFMFNSDTLRFFYVNGGAIRQLGYSADELMKMTPFDIKPNVNEEQFRNIIAPLISGNKKITTFETIHQHKKGEQIPVEIFLQYIHLPNEAPYFMAIIRDITDRNLIEKILVKFNGKLEDEVRIRTAELIQAKEKAINANNAKSKFLSFMSHEIRTPLTAVLGYSEFIEMSSKDENTKNNAKQIITASYHILELTNDLLDLSKIESGNIILSIESHYLTNILNSTLSLIKPIADKYKIQIINNVYSHDDIKINVDEMQFKQVLLNILSNAIKYNSTKGNVIIDCSTNNGNTLNLSITDSGNGLAPEQLSNIFQPFNRVGAENSDIEGTGLGLEISKSLMEQMGGKITVTSEIGNGTCFVVHVPLA